MKTKHLFLVGLCLILATFLVPEKSVAGWGAIACNQNNANCGVSYGWSSRAAAESHALFQCHKANRYCHIWRWEYNMCIRGPYGAYTCN